MKILKLFITKPYFGFNPEEMYYMSQILVMFESDNLEDICKSSSSNCPKFSHKHVNIPVRFEFDVFDVEGTEKLYPEGHGPIREERITDTPEIIIEKINSAIQKILNENTSL